MINRFLFILICINFVLLYVDENSKFGKIIVKFDNALLITFIILMCSFCYRLINHE